LPVEFDNILRKITNSLLFHNIIICYICRTDKNLCSIATTETVSQSAFVIAKRLSGVVAIFMLSKTYEIASVVILPQRHYDTVSTADDLT